MLSAAKPQAGLQNQRLKLKHLSNQLAESYTALYDEFASKDLRNVGNYRLGSLIGKGSFGKVYLATHKLTNGSKVVLKSANKDDSNLAREIHHHRQFSHPHIARLYEVIVTETLVWLVLEYCPGDELYHHLTEHGSLEPAKAQRIFTQIIGAVSYVHNRSCVHRDLKLENILLDKNHNVKLVDFGFTREYESKGNCLQTWCGTVCYSAPEMLKGEKYAGEKVDVWSLGIILYALLCGELPFDEDDENETKMKILKEEPKYPETMPTPARDLINLMLSKRPLLRPSLADVLTNSWLAEHAPQQQAILKLQQPPPFATALEKDTLQRMRSSGVNIDLVIENVLSQRCDSLAGWWALLIEKEERKAKRKERKRRGRDADAKTSRRISAASARLERIAPTIKETDEEGVVVNGTAVRGRDPSHSGASNTLDQVPEAIAVKKLPPTPRAPSTRTVRATSASRRRSQLGPRDYSKRNSAMSIIATNQEMLPTEAGPKKRRRRIQQPFMHQLASIKHWFKESAKRSKSPTSSQASANLHPDGTPKQIDHNALRVHPDTNVHTSSAAQPRPDMPSQKLYPARPRVLTNSSSGSGQRQPSSPSPITPSASYHRNTSSTGRGRKSTSSSVSSMRSMPAHRASHSVASSTSSNSVASPNLSAQNSFSQTRRISPHISSVKVLPKTPTAGSPLETRGLRPPPKPLNLGGENSSAFTGLGPPSPGLVFARRKRTPFKGPMLGPGSARRRGASSSSDPRRNSVISNKSGKIIEEEDEDEEGEDDFEEVDAFSPITGHDEVIETFPEDVHNLTHTPGATASREATPQLEETLRALESPPELRFKRQAL